MSRSCCCFHLEIALNSTQDLSGHQRTSHHCNAKLINVHVTMANCVFGLWFSFWLCFLICPKDSSRNQIEFLVAVNKLCYLFSQHTHIFFFWSIYSGWSWNLQSRVNISISVSVFTNTSTQILWYFSFSNQFSPKDNLNFFRLSALILTISNFLWIQFWPRESNPFEKNYPFNPNLGEPDR